MKNKYRTPFMVPFIFGLFLLTSGLASCSDEKAKPQDTQGTPTQNTKEKRLQLSPGSLKEIPGSSGIVVFQDNSKGVFVGRVELSGLAKGSYLMTLNENNQFPIDRELTGWRAWGSEQYLDFEQIYVNETGVYNGEFEVDLPSGRYTFKFFIKEAGGSYPSVLYNDFLKVKVQ